MIGIYDFDMVTAADYTPFGRVMLGRNFSFLSRYRYGFNGKEMDNEVKGAGNLLDYGNRLYDPLVGRFWSVDPLTSTYPELTPYQFASNTPIQGTDLDGLEISYHYNDSRFGVVVMPAGDNLRRQIPPEHLKYLPQEKNKRSQGIMSENTSMILDNLPVVGTIKGAVEGVVGYDAAGNKLSVFQRSTGFVPYIGKAKKTLRVLKAVDKADEVKDITKAANKIDDAVSNEKSLVKVNKEAGDLREATEKVDLEKMYPGADVQGQRYLRDANGKIVKDPLTGEARRVDFGVIKDKKVLDMVETTSRKANKTAQTAKEERIRQAGGTYIRDKKTKEVLDVKDVPTRLNRRD